MNSIIYKVCKRTIEKAIDNGTVDQIRDDMMGKLDLYAAANKITLDEYNELVTLLNPNA